MSNKIKKMLDQDIIDYKESLFQQGFTIDPTKPIRFWKSLSPGRRGEPYDPDSYLKSEGSFVRPIGEGDRDTEFRGER
jgi:hypothetical protein